MKKYNLKDLDNDCFEQLIVDLHSHKTGQVFSKTNPGKDEGIDGYSFNKNNLVTILQAKHYDNKNNLNGVMKEEKIKINSLHYNVNDYFLYTSCKLQLKDKQKILEIMNPNIKSINNVFDYNDIIQLIHSTPMVELKYYQLWIPSSTVMFWSLENIVDRIFNRKTYAEKEQRLEEKKSLIERYVEDKNLSKALEHLEKNNVLIISGLPGVGKTTLANIVCNIYENKGYEFAPINNIEDYYNLKYLKKKKYIIYFDDFLGSIDYKIKDELEAKKIINVIERILTNQNIKLVITTREFVLNQAKEKSEAFKDINFSLNKLVIAIKDYNNYQKLLILIKHLEFYEITKNQIEHFLEDNKVLDIIKHKNYFPRTIDNTISLNKDTNKINIADELILNLKDCTRIWETIFENGLESIDISILLLLYFSTGKLTIESISEKMNIYGFDKLYIKERVKYLERKMCLLKLQKNKNGNLEILFADPSIQDYLKKYIIDNIYSLEFLMSQNTEMNFLINILDELNDENLLKNEHNTKYDWFYNEFVNRLVNDINKSNKRKLDNPNTVYFARSDSYNLKRFYNLLNIAEEHRLLNIFDIISKDLTGSANYYEITFDIDEQVKNNAISKYSKKCLISFLSRIREDEYYKIISWEDYFKKYNLLNELKDSIKNVEREVSVEDFYDDDNIERKIEEQEESIYYIKQIESWYEESNIFENELENRDIIIQQFSEDLNTDNKSFDEPVYDSQKDLYDYNKNDDIDDNKILEIFSSHFSL